MIIHDCKLNMTSDGRVSDIWLNQRDDNARIIFHLYSSDGEFAIASGTTAKLQGQRKDGEPIVIDATVDRTARTVTAEVTKAMAQAAGPGTFEILLTCNGKELRSRNFKIRFERAAYQGVTTT